MFQRRWLVWGGLLALHAALVMYFVRPGALREGPIQGGDWDTHIEQCARALDAFRGHGASWGYDPQMFAGSPSGVIFDADNKLHELVVNVLVMLGFGFGAAFNAFVLVAHVSVPFVAFAGARLFELSRRAATVAAALAVCLWFFDSLIHWGWWVGSISWAFGALASVLPVGLFHRWERTRRLPWLAGVAAALSATLLLHPYTFFAMAPPMLVIYARGVRARMTPREHAAVWGAALVAVLANLHWLRVAFRFFHYVLDSAYLGGTSLLSLGWDFFGYLDDPHVTGYIAVRTSFRFFTLGAALLGIARFRRLADPRALLFGTAVVLPLLLAYPFGSLHALRQIQPIRFVFAAAFFGAIVAGAELETLASEARAWMRSPGAKAAFGLAALVLFPKAALDVWYFFPGLMPRSKTASATPQNPVGGGFDNAGLVFGLHGNYAHYPPDDADRRLLLFVRDHDDGTGRWLVEWSTLGERLAWATRAQVLGGFPYFNLAHNDANWFRLLGARRDGTKLAAYLDTYNVSWLIRTAPENTELDRPDLFEHVFDIGPHRIYRTRRVASFVALGAADVKASFNRIEVRGSGGGSLVLKYHFLESLACRPNCRVTREASPVDRVGFIRVTGAPADFEIENRY